MFYLSTGLLDAQIKITPTVELWTSRKPKNISQASSIKVAFEDNGTTDRLAEMLENFDHKE